MSDMVDAHVLAQYDIVQKVGQGAYGIVWKAISKKTQQVVALKKCFDAFQHEVDAQRTYREIMILNELRGQGGNFVEIYDVLRASNDLDIYIVCDFMESDLHNIIKKCKPSELQIKYILFQILKAVKYLHSGGLIHRDLKPSNILVNRSCYAKLCDFGLSRSVEDDCTLSIKRAPSICIDSDPRAASAATLPVMTDYVATRWYRAPELLLSSTSYSKAVDVWAIGCIVGEMLNGKPVFVGKTLLDQLQQVVDVTGYPTEDDIRHMKHWKACHYLNSIKSKSNRPLAETFPSASMEVLDFINKCLQFNPNKRLTAAQLLEHPFLAQFAAGAVLPECPKIIRIPTNDSVRLTVNEYREKLYQEIRKRKETEIIQEHPHIVPPLTDENPTTSLKPTRQVATDHAVGCDGVKRPTTKNIPSYASTSLKQKPSRPPTREAGNRVRIPLRPASANPNQIPSHKPPSSVAQATPSTCDSYVRRPAPVTFGAYTKMSRPSSVSVNGQLNRKPAVCRVQK